MDHFKSLYWICDNIASVLCLGFLGGKVYGILAPTRDQTHALALEGKVLTTGPPGSPPPPFSFTSVNSFYLSFSSPPLPHLHNPVTFYLYLFQELYILYLFLCCVLPSVAIYKLFYFSPSGIKCGFLTEISSQHCWRPNLSSQDPPRWWLGMPVFLHLGREHGCRLSQKC